MPRFLNTWTGEFECHNNPAEVRYAILSHVWRTPGDGGEQTFDDVRQIQEAAKVAQERPRGLCSVDWTQATAFDPLNAPFPNDASRIFSDRPTLSDNLYASNPDGLSVAFSAGSPLSDKIKGLCKVAREAGFRLVWNDTCCIDKSSSAELSEAINSMYEWYRLSDMCYVYLADVPDGDVPQGMRSHFRESRWLGRGWTLQELVAPERVEFLTSSWSALGTKLGLVDVLAEATRIDIDILTGQASVDSASVAQRTSWAAERKTTRVEDEAYCLMGLFGVHMAPIYGEGRNAFLRLQEEIIKTIPDQSIFAWGSTCILDSQLRSRVYPVSYHFPHNVLSAPITNYHTHPALLASSPRVFTQSTMRPVTPAEFASRLRLKGTEEVPPLDCSFTPQGVRIRLLCLDLKKVPRCGQIFLPQYGDLCEECIRHGEPDTLALLQCEDGQGNLAALPLHPSSTAFGSGHGPGRPVGTYVACERCAPCLSRGDELFHIVLYSRDALARILECVRPEAVEVFILRHHANPPRSKSLRLDYSLPPLVLWAAGHPNRATFAIAPQSIAGLRAHGFTASPLQIERYKDESIVLESTLAPPNTASGSCDGEYLQSIRVRVSLSLDHTPNPSTGIGRLNDTKIQFHLSHIDPLRAGSTETSSPSTPPSGSSFVATTDGRKLIPCIGDHETAQTCFSPFLRYQYTLAYADFLLPSEHPDRPNSVRLLRLSLERSVDSLSFASSRGSAALWLAVEMSPEYEHVPKAGSVLDNLHDARIGETNSVPEDPPSLSCAQGEEVGEDESPPSDGVPCSFEILPKALGEDVEDIASLYSEWATDSHPAGKLSFAGIPPASDISEEQPPPASLARDVVASYGHSRAVPEGIRATASQPLKVHSLPRPFTSPPATPARFDGSNSSCLKTAQAHTATVPRAAPSGSAAYALSDLCQSSSRGTLTPRSRAAVSSLSDTISEAEDSITPPALSPFAASTSMARPDIGAHLGGQVTGTPSNTRARSCWPTSSATRETASNRTQHRTFKEQADGRNSGESVAQPLRDMVCACAPELPSDRTLRCEPSSDSPVHLEAEDTLRAVPLSETCSNTYADDSRGDTDTSTTGSVGCDSVAALQRENDELRARMSAMASQNMELSSRVDSLSAQNSMFSAQMAEVLSRLEALVEPSSVGLPAVDRLDTTEENYPSNSATRERI